MKKILNIVLKSVLGAGIVLLFIFANKKQSQVLCPEFVIELKDQGMPLISRFYIRSLITESGIKVKGQPLEAIDLEKIHQVIAGSPFVKSVNLTVDVNGKVKVNVEQRRPIVRVIDFAGNQFYLDSEGKRVPISHEFTARLLVANGKIRTLQNSNTKSGMTGAKESYQLLTVDLQNIFVVAKQLECDEFTKALVEQIYLNSNGEIELIPKIGEQTILLGDTTSLKEKLEKLKIFYTQGNRNEAWSTYRSINLKYRDQVICKKTI
jgi:cell division protein FtsQ